MVFIDSHCHIDSYSDDKINQIISNAKQNNVGIIINNGLNHKTNLKTLALSLKHDEIKAALGLYPIDALKLNDDEIKNELLFIEENKDKIIAIGEIGIDLKWSKELEKQKKNFELLIDLAKKINKPIIVHSRLAEKQVLEIMEDKGVKKAIIHCFNGKLKLTDKIIKNKWSLSIPTNITYSDNFVKLVEKVPIELLFCETDSPYLHPIKGKRNNEPFNVIKSYEKIAEIKGLKLEEVKAIIKENYDKLFNS